MIPISRFIDHGDNVENRAGTPGAEEWAMYQEVSRGKWSQAKPGEKIPMRGVDGVPIPARTATALASSSSSAGSSSSTWAT
jgi:hypothetical protein